MKYIKWYVNIFLKLCIVFYLVMWTNYVTQITNSRKKYYIDTIIFKQDYKIHSYIQDWIQEFSLTRVLYSSTYAQIGLEEFLYSSIYTQIEVRHKHFETCKGMWYHYISYIVLVFVQKPPQLSDFDWVKDHSYCNKLSPSYT